jgi:Mrp family chromosome partitioning ATPase
MSPPDSLRPVFVSRLGSNPGSAALREASLPQRIETGCLVTMEPGLSTAAAVPYFSQLAQKLMSVPAAQPRAFVFTSAERGDGVTFTARSVAGALAHATGERVAIVGAETLGTGDCLTAPQDTGFGDSQCGVCTVTRRPTHSKNWEARRVRRGLDEIGAQFRWILIDSPPLRDSTWALAIAPQTSGVVFVVSADKTKRSDIAEARRAIQLSSGVLLGFVLNKRTWPVPESLRQRFERGRHS